MGNKKINIDRPKMSSEEVREGMDFGQLMAQYGAAAGATGAGLASKPWYKTGWFVGSAAITIVAAVTVTVLFGPWSGADTDLAENTANENGSADFTNAFTESESSFISMPFPDLEPEKDRFLVDAGSGAKYLHGTGSVVTIPENAFVDDQGAVVTGTVEVEYIEYHDHADFFLSGIPMDYDSAGENYVFHSAGMLEINAYQNGKPVHANPDNLIEVAIASQYQGTEFNVYYLDTANKNWSFMGKDRVTPKGLNEPLTPEEVLAWQNHLLETYDERAKAASGVDPDQWIEENMTPMERQEIEQIEADQEAVREEMEQFQETEPKRPPRFNLDYDVKEFPELEAFRNLYFEIGLEAANNHFSTNDYSVEWEDMKLEENEKGKNYKLTLTAGELKKTYIVYPVYEGGGVTDAMKDFEARLESYQEKLDQRKTKESRLAAELEAKRQEILRRNEELQAMAQAEREQWEAERARIIAAREKAKERMEALMSMEEKVTRAFTISNFGVWNCDNPVKGPSSRKVEATFVADNGTPLNLNTVALVDHNINGVIKYWNGEFSKFRYDKDSDNMIWAVTPEGKLAICRNDEFGKISAGQKKHGFTLQVIDRKFNSSSEIKEFLKLKTRV